MHRIHAWQPPVVAVGGQLGKGAVPREGSGIVDSSAGVSKGPKICATTYYTWYLRPDIVLFASRKVL